MKLVKVIMLEHLSGLGRTGDAVSVKLGYFRNFLFPRGKAIYASQENMKVFEQRRAELEKRDNERLNQANELYHKIHQEKVYIMSVADEDGRLYGSVTQKDVADAVNGLIKKHGSSDVVAPSQCLLSDKLKALGTYEIDVELHPDVTAVVSLVVRNSKQEISDVTENGDSNFVVEG